MRRTTTGASTGFPGRTAALIADGTIYAMEGDQSEVVALLDDLVSRYAGLDATGVAEEGQAARA